MNDNNVIEIIPGRYFIGVWYMYGSNTLDHQDWMGTVFRDPADPPNHWHMRYRHKYYNSKDPFDGKDRRSSYTATVNGTESEVIEKMDAMLALTSAMGGFQRDFLYMGTADSDALIERLRSREWVHMRTQERRHER